MSDRRRGARDRRGAGQIIALPQGIRPSEIVKLPVADNGGRRRDAATRMLFDDITRGAFLPCKMQLTHPDEAYQYGFAEGVREALRRRLPTPAAIEGEP